MIVYKKSIQELETILMEFCYTTDISSNKYSWQIHAWALLQEIFGKLNPYEHGSPNPNPNQLRKL